jgi:hypothetical protein
MMGRVKIHVRTIVRENYQIRLNLNHQLKRLRVEVKTEE